MWTPPFGSKIRSERGPIEIETSRALSNDLYGRDRFLKEKEKRVGRQNIQRNTFLSLSLFIFLLLLSLFLLIIGICFSIGPTDPC